MIHLNRDQSDLAIVFDHLLSFMVKTEMCSDSVLEMLEMEVQRLQREASDRMEDNVVILFGAVIEFIERTRRDK